MSDRYTFVVTCATCGLGDRDAEGRKKAPCHAGRTHRGTPKRKKPRPQFNEREQGFHPRGAATATGAGAEQEPSNWKSSGLQRTTELIRSMIYQMSNKSRNCASA